MNRMKASGTRTLTNSLPEPYKEISESRFRHLFWHMEALRVEYCQLHRPTFREAWIFWYPGHGLAMVHDNTWHLDASGEIEYERPLQYYYLGCEHKRYQRTSPWARYHQYVCEDCGHRWAHDSSD